MSDLFKKLNTLVKSTVNDALRDMISDSLRQGASNPLSKRLEQDVATLRERINVAIAYEDELQKRIRDIETEIVEQDQQADAAVKQGNDALARHFVEKVQRLKQRLAMAESDLREHQIVAQELIRRVNLLDATVSESRYSVTDEKLENQGNTPAGLEQTDKSKMTKFSSLVEETRDKLTELGDKITTHQQRTTESMEINEDPVSTDTVDKDLAARLDRLSKR